MTTSFTQRGKDLLRTTSFFYAFMVLMLAAYFAVRIANLAYASEKVKSTADTTSYLRISRDPILSSDFLAGTRPLLFPLVVKLLNGNGERVAWVQGIISILSWGALAWSVSLSMRSILLRYASFGLVLLLSLYQYIIGWDSVLLTESLSLSLMALFLAGWLWLGSGWRWYKTMAILIVSILWGFCRDTNAWVLLMIALILLAFVSFRSLEKKYLVLSVVFGIIFILSNLTADLGGRWVFPFQNVLGRRILPNPEAVAYFAACGMPVSPELMSLKNENANGLDRAFYVDPALETYRTWLYESGKGCYMKWLISNPVRTFREPFKEFNSLLGIQNLPAFLFSKQFVPVLPGRVERLLYPSGLPLLVFFLALGLVAFAILKRDWMEIDLWWVAGIMVILVLPHYLLVWHGDILGIERHVVPAGIQLYLGAWLLLMLVLDNLISAEIFKKR